MGQQAIASYSDTQQYTSLEDWFHSHDINPVFIKLRGNSAGNTDYRAAKQPLSKDWTKIKTITDKEIEKHINQGGWIGLVVPGGYIVVDVDDKKQFQYLAEHLTGYVNHIAISTPNGGQFIFRDRGTVGRQGTKIITAGGVVIDYRLAGKGQIVMPTNNTEGRHITHMDPDIDPMPLFFYSVRPFRQNKDQDVVVPVPIREGQRDDVLFRHASRLREWNTKHSLKLSNDEIVELLHQVNHFLCEPPLDENTVDDKVKSALSYSTASKSPDHMNGEPRYPYYIDEEGYLCRWKEKGDQQISIRLANFNAQIVEEISEDNGLERTHYFTVKGVTQGRPLPPAKVTASQFSSLGWVSKEWGNQAILEAGQNTKDLVRHAIQVQSAGAKRLTIFTHTGWREIDGQWAYLSGGGAIGCEDVLVSLPESLQRYRIPLAIDKAKEIEAIRLSLSFLDIGTHGLTFPLYALLWLSPVTTLLNPMPNFSGYAYGDTGTFKTTVAMLLLSHFGDFSQANNLSNFDDTANAIEKKSFTLKDALLVLDDYHPSSRQRDAQNKEQLAQRLIREYSNRTARDRLNSDTTEKGRYTPRGMLLITGEELVQLQSTLARILVLEFLRHDIDKEKLTTLQEKASLLPYAMTSYIVWVRDNIDDIQKTFQDKFRVLRARASRENTHRKLPEQVAFMQFAFETMQSWAVDRGVLGETEAKDLSEEAWGIFNTLSVKQSERIDDDEPIKKFTDIVTALISQKTVKLEHRGNEVGSIKGGENGDLIGYYDENYWYMLPVPLWHNVNRYCAQEQAHFPLTRDTLYRRLANKGFIKVENGRHTINVRIKGEQKRVLKFIARGICQNEVAEVTDAS